MWLGVYSIFAKVNGDCHVRTRVAARDVVSIFKHLHVSLRDTFYSFETLPNTTVLSKTGYASLTVFISLQEFEVLSQIRVLQASCSQYNLPHHPRIAAWLQGHKLLTDQER